MNRREENKELKRDKIISAAKEIISSEGLDKLTMRYLADYAGVSSRTPYNLFESKTDILVAIIMDAMKPLKLSIFKSNDQLLIEQTLNIPNILRDFCKTDHDFYRDIIWGIMSSGIKSSRDTATSAISDIVPPLIQQIVNQKECSDKINVRVLSSHIATQFLAIIGMWGGSQLGLNEAIINIQLAWTNSLMPYATRKSKAFLTQAQLDFTDQLELAIDNKK